MGYIRRDFGDVSIEQRRESFIVHLPDNKWDRRDPHPEFYLSDLDNLIAALEELKRDLR